MVAVASKAASRKEFLEFMFVSLYRCFCESGLYGSGLYESGLYESGLYESGLYKSGLCFCFQKVFLEDL